MKKFLYIILTGAIALTPALNVHAASGMFIKSITYDEGDGYRYSIDYEYGDKGLLKSATRNHCMTFSIQPKWRRGKNTLILAQTSLQRLFEGS